MVAPFHEPMVSPVIVGRAPHLAFFDRILHDCRSGTGHTLLVSGEPGIGKSRLVSEGKRRARGMGFLVLEGSCFEPDRSLPYAPVADLLRGHISGCPPERVAGRLGPGAAEFVKVLPELAGRPGVPRAPASLEPAQEQRRLFQALARFVTELSRRGPVLMLVEDLHWSDELSLALLLELARRIPQQPVLLLLTYRSDEVSPGLSQLLAALDRQRLASEVTLSPLDPADVEAMVRAILGLDRPSRSEFLADLYALTEGNPFFVEEVLRSLVHTGEIFHLRSGWDRRPTAGLPIPRSVHESVRRRSAGLSARAAEALVLAAVAGRRFDAGLLRDLLGADEQELVAVIKELTGAQLVVETSADHVAFRHALTREAIESGLLARERRRLHRLVGEGLERLHAGGLEAHVSDLARHFHEAGVWEKVLHYATKAGERARALYAPHAAAEQFSLALEAATHLGQADLHLHRSRGLAYETLGEFDRGLADLEAALALARRAGDGRAQWQGLIDLGLLWAARDYARTGACYREAMMLARSTDDRALLAQTLNWLGNWHLNVAQPVDGLRCHREALAIFEELGDRRGVAETLDLLALAANMEDNLVESVTHIRRAITLFRDLDDRQRLCSSLSVLANSLGDRLFHDVASHPGLPPDEAVGRAEEAIQLAREIEWRSGEAYALINLACCLGSLGEYGRGLSAGRDALSLAEEMGHVEWTAGASCALGAIYRDLLVADRAREHLERALNLARDAGSPHWVGCAAGLLASACLMEGQPDSAESALSAASSGGPGRTTPDRLCRAARAELALQRGSPADALAIVDELLCSAPGGGFVPRLSKLRGDALAALGSREDAEGALLQARRSAQAQGLRPRLWRIDVSLARLYRDWRRRADAEEALRSARTVVEELAAGIPDPDLRTRFLEESGRLVPPPRPPTDLQAAKRAFGGLTGREREVAALIASGKANREIADALVLSDRTVEGHVANIMAKLAVGTRAQIAAWAVEKGLTRVLG